MQNLIDILSKSQLFNSLDSLDIKEMIDKTSFTIKEYKKNELIALESTPCNSIGIILHGTIEIKKILENGNNVTLNKMSSGNIFGEVIIFSNKNTYPSTIESTTNSKILFFSKEDVLMLCSTYKDFLVNFIGLLSNKTLMLNDKIKNMSYSSIKQKLAYYLLEEYRRQKTKRIKLPFSKMKLSEFLALPRPSLSREFMKLKEDGLIYYDKNYVDLLDIKGLEEILY